MTSILDKNNRKRFHSCDNNILFGYDIIQGIQQATSISFFPFVGYQSGNRKKTHFALLGSRSEHRFPARSRVPPAGPNIIWRGTSSSCYSKFPGSFKKNINEEVCVLELIILLKRDFVQQFSIALREILHMHFVEEQGR